MPLQLGRCAFTAACIFPGLRLRIRGTNREVCVVHARTFVLAFESPAPQPVDGTVALRLPGTAGTSFCGTVKKA